MFLPPPLIIFFYPLFKKQNKKPSYSLQNIQSALLQGWWVGVGGLLGKVLLPLLIKDAYLLNREIHNILI